MFDQAPTVQSSREKRILKLFPEDSLGAIVEGVTDAIYSSIKSHGMRSNEVSFAEKKRRFAICMDWAIVLRAELQWGVERIRDAMPAILKTELDGVKWKPPQRQCWIPQDGR